MRLCARARWILPVQCGACPCKVELTRARKILLTSEMFKLRLPAFAGMTARIVRTYFVPFTGPAPSRLEFSTGHSSRSSSCLSCPRVLRGCFSIPPLLRHCFLDQLQGHPRAEVFQIEQRALPKTREAAVR